MKIAILAGSYRQFMDHTRDGNEGEEFFYIDHPDKLRGCRFDRIDIIGSFWEKENSHKLLEETKTRTITLCQKPTPPNYPH